MAYFVFGQNFHDDPISSFYVKFLLIRRQTESLGNVTTAIKCGNTRVLELNRQYTEQLALTGNVVCP